MIRIVLLLVTMMVTTLYFITTEEVRNILNYIPGHNRLSGQ